MAVDILSDLVLHPRFAADDVEKEKGVVIEEIKMVEDMPDDLVHELFLQGYWTEHPLGRPILGTAESVSALTPAALREYFDGAYTADRLIVTVAGTCRTRAGARSRSSGVRPGGGWARRSGRRGARADAARHPPDEGPRAEPPLSRASAPTRSSTRIATSLLVLNTVLGGSMSSRLFQNVREKRGLAYSVGQRHQRVPRCRAC